MIASETDEAVSRRRVPAGRRARHPLFRGEDADRRLRQRLTEATAALAEPTEFAADVDLPYDVDELTVIRDGLHAYRVALAAWRRP